ncbi:cytochrome c [Dyella sp. M7H15-1]|uniref:c-type cytochrome n=1 Tax=Dyella sp. M7H15-1 TaxID=2501295 RepID=UPI001004F8BF|nr:cytochrome c [Dyella sp. M7H15-1]QAU24846.1 cytochrome c [Dyella sp. M7H15-1]
MKHACLAWWVSCALCVGGVLASTPDGAMIAQQGNGHSAAPCMACHGMDGGGQAAAGFPRLAGLPEAYLRKQLEDFADGSRDNATMLPVVGALTDAERDAVVVYYSKLPVPVPASTEPLKESSAQVGQALAARGRWSDRLPACEQCHGPGGMGVGDHFPPLSGQSSVYLSNELHAWKQGARHNDPLQLMQSVASKLSDDDIAAISAWYATQPVAPGKEQQP